MMIHEVEAAVGAHKKRHRVGRGEGSGSGKTCGRGTKGSGARAGGGVAPLYEGGQMPLFMKVAKRGFSNFNFRTEYEVVNLSDLSERFKEGELVDVAALAKQRLVRSPKSRVKLLGNGALAHKFNIEVHAASKSAREAVEKSGGQLKLINAGPSAADKWRAKRGAARKKAAAQANA
jgi:large subunit ribosomal protein L15